MAYALHIERLSLERDVKAKPIPLEDWKRALSSLEGARLCVEKALIMKTDTSKIISIPHRDGDAEVYFPNERKWHAVFRWFNGSATFQADVALEHLPNPVWTAAVSLASQLGAMIRGDDGERYDFQAGKVVNG